MQYRMMEKLFAGLRPHRGQRAAGNEGVGRFKGATERFIFFVLVEREKKFLVLTDEEFYRNLATDLTGKLAADVDLVLCKLPDDLEREVKRVRITSRRELGF